MLRWFVFTIGMGLLPFGFSVLLQTLRGIAPGQWQNSPELFFFSSVVCASQLDGIFASLASIKRRAGDRERALLVATFGLFLLGAILAAALYGVYVDHARNDPARVIGATCGVAGGRTPSYTLAGVQEHCSQWLAFQGNLFTFSLWMAGMLGTWGTITEWIRTRRQP